MVDALNTSSTFDEIYATSLLCYQCAVSVSTDFHSLSSNSGSTAYLVGGAAFNSAGYALSTYFKYNCQEIHKSDYTNSNWIALMKTEIDNHRPVIYSGNSLGSGGHAFVLDGYNNSNQFHFNWGWGGTNDGFFAIGSLNPMGSDGFDSNNCAIIGITPNDCRGDVSMNQYLLKPSYSWNTHTATTAPTCGNIYKCELLPNKTYTFTVDLCKCIYSLTE